MAADVAAGLVVLDLDDFRADARQAGPALSSHGHVGYALVTNKAFWDSLPPDVRTILDGVVKDATACNNSITEKENVDSLALIRKTGKAEVVTLSPDERLARKRALMKVHQEAAGRLGPDLIGSI
jgi:C4-dicarboxylate-binding protein DctP